MKILLLLLCALAGMTVSQAQNVPIGEWGGLFGYMSANHVVDTGKRIFCSSYNGLFSVDHAGKEIRIFSKSEGLTDVGISSMACDAGGNNILIAYRSGNLDLLILNESSELTEVVNLPVLLQAAGLPDNKQINRIVFHENLAYLGSNFGIIVIDTQLHEVRETYRYIGPQGTEANVQDLAFTTDSLFAATAMGLIGTSLKNTVNRQYFASWKTIPTKGQITSLIAANHVLYGGFPGMGIMKRKGNAWVPVYNSSSKTTSFSQSAERIAAAFENEAITFDLTETPVVYKNPLFTSLSQPSLTASNTLWLADKNQGLLGNPNNIFHSYSPIQKDSTISNRADSSVIDETGLTWSRLPAYLGGGIAIKDPKTGKQRFLSTSAAGGSLPSSIINSLAEDTDGYIWFASDNGVGYFLPYDALTLPRLDAILPIFGQRKLLTREQCTALAVEPGNRKWIGTKKGLYLFSSDGSELLLHFSAENSPLPSNEIKALRFESQTGLLYIDTPNGMVSYRSDATTPEERFSTVTIFPNPVRPGYSGNLGIKGLMNNSFVKITSLSGRLIYEARSQGGTVSWNLNDYTGRRAAGGIYIVMAISEDKSAKFVGKFAVID